MSAFAAGDRIRNAEYPTLVGTVTTAEPDGYGQVVVRWDKWAATGESYDVVKPDQLQPLPKRYVVELRAPVVGERIIYANTATTAVQDDERTTRFVIVDEVTP